MTVKLKMLQKYAAFEVGEEVEFSDKKAARLIAAGVGEVVKPKKRKGAKK